MIAEASHARVLCCTAMLAVSFCVHAQSPAPDADPSAPASGAPLAPPPLATVQPGTVPPPPPPVAAPRPKQRMSALALVPDWKKLERLSNILSREEFEGVFSKIYSNGNAGPVPWTITPEAISIETGPGTPPVRIAFRSPSADEALLPRFWRKPSELPKLKPGEPPLTGLHIALDPGHIGGSYATMEERWLSMAPGEAIMEGHLVLEVANLLKIKLEALGARVSLVRTQEAPVTTAKPADFRDQALTILKEAGIAAPADRYDGVKGDAKFATLQYQEEKLFYRVSEIRARAARVNGELKPDLVLCLHLNADEWGDPGRPSFSPNNHFHLLINGCYSNDELHLDDVRFDMFERLFARIHEEERALADPLAAAVAKETGLAPFTYPHQNARRVSSSPYVWARNLLANRLYQCPVIYFEPYVMNNEQTYHRLLLGPFVGRTLMGSELVTSPQEDYARGVALGLEQYYTKARGQ